MSNSGSKKKFEYDSIVIGTGPAGEGAAMMMSKSGKKVLSVESYAKVGGGCTHWATIPSKALRQAIISFLGLSQTPYLGKNIYNVENRMPSMSDFLEMTKQVIESQSRMRQNFYIRNRVETKCLAKASFIDEHTLELDMEDGKTKRVQAENIVIAVGSRPLHPKGLSFEHPRILDSDTALLLKEAPATLTIYGAGVIGCEYACIFKNLGTKVDLINTRQNILDFLDKEISDALSYHMRNTGIVLRNGEEFSSIKASADKTITNLKSGKQIKNDYVLFTQGRVGNSEGLGLDALGIEVNDRGHIVVNDSYQTTRKNIFAVGDVIGWPSLASAAYDEGRSVGALISGVKDFFIKSSQIPTGIYTSPEISCIGLTEEELTSQKIPYEVGIAHYKSLAKAQMFGDDVGLLKLLFHRETLEVLGVHCFGREATEIIHIGQAVMSLTKNQNSMQYFIKNTFNYPTMAEAYRVAALNGINRL